MRKKHHQKPKRRCCTCARTIPASKPKQVRRCDRCAVKARVQASSAPTESLRLDRLVQRENLPACLKTADERMWG